MMTEWWEVFVLSACVFIGGTIFSLFLFPPVIRLWARSATEGYYDALRKQYEEFM